MYGRDKKPQSLLRQDPDPFSLAVTAVCEQSTCAANDMARILAWLWQENLLGESTIMACQVIVLVFTIKS